MAEGRRWGEAGVGRENLSTEATANDKRLRAGSERLEREGMVSNRSQGSYLGRRIDELVGLVRMCGAGFRLSSGH